MIHLTEDVRASLAKVGEALDDALLLVDQGAAVQFANRAARALLELPAEDATLGVAVPWQRALRDLLHRLPVEGAATEVHVTGGQPQVLEGFAVQQDGAFWGGIFVVRSAPARRSESPPAPARAFAHEVKNALHSILLNLYMLRKWAASQAAVEPQILAKFDLVSREIHRLNGLAESHLPDDRPRVRREVVRLPQLLGEVVARVTPPAREAGIEIRSRLPADLPPLPGDTRLLRDAFLALIENRLDAVGQGGELEIQAGVGGKQAFVMVTDSGPGIRGPVEARPARSGRGLGLTEWVVRGHEGSFETFSGAGLGSTVVVKLPLTTSTPAVGQADTGLTREA
jgi:signal transduction histidine kinase